MREFNYSLIKEQKPKPSLQNLVEMGIYMDLLARRTLLSGTENWTDLKTRQKI